MTSSQAAVVDDALSRLVESIVGIDAEETHNHDELLDLARRIVSSRVGATRNQEGSSSNGDNLTWRRIERSSSAETSKRVRQLYKQIQQGSASSGNPDCTLAVLSKVANISSSSSSNASSTNVASRATDSAMQPTGNRVDATRDEKLLAKQVLHEETLVIRECLYALQGIDGERIQVFQEDGEIRVCASPLLESVALNPNIPSRLGSGYQDAIRICGEAAWFHSRIKAFLERHDSGIISRALAGALSTRLAEYYALLASMEANLFSSTLTVRELLVKLRETTFSLQVMAMLCDGVGHLRGGQLLSALCQHSLHGDTRHASIVKNLLSSASQPWYHLLFLWTTRGELVDAYDEFSIQYHPDGRELWRDRYTLREAQMVPACILDHDLVRPTWILGKGINFIRNSLGDAEWRLDLGQEVSPSTTTEQQCRQLGFAYLLDTNSSSRDSKSTLRRTLLRAGEQVHSHILKSLIRDHSLMEHLWGLKQFLFLGQGDFFSAFMDGMNAEFTNRRGLAGVYKHTLMSILEEAVRSTNAREMPPEVLGRLQAEIAIPADDDAMYQFAAPRDSPDGDQRSVWDVVQFDYTVPDTLTAIVDKAAMKQYKVVFALLFRLKRVEFVLNATWRQSTALHHALQTFAQHNAIHASTSSGYSQVLVLLRKISMARQSMMHFVGNLKSYFMYEVLEGGWKDLKRYIEAAETLDEVIDAHHRYLDRVVRKSLLGGTADVRATKSEKALATRLQELLVTAKAFCVLQESLFIDALSAVERATEKRREAERRMEEGKWGFNKEEDFQEEESFFGLTDKSILQDVDRILQDFDEKTVLLLEEIQSVANGAEATPAVGTISPATPSSRGRTKTASTWTTTDAGLVSDPFDHDSLRFLAFQLNYSSYFGEKY